MPLTLIFTLPEMSKDQIILLAYGVGLVMGFCIARLYPKRKKKTDRSNVTVWPPGL